MAQTPEGKVKDAIKKYLKTLEGCFFFLPVSNGMGGHGIPDFIICYKGWFLAIETKAPGKEGNLTPMQTMRIDDIRKAGGVAIVASEVGIVRETIKMLDTL